VEAEYVGLSEAAKEVVFLKGFVSELIGKKSAIKLYDDSAQKLAQNHVFHNSSKHNDLQYHHVRDQVIMGVVVIEYCLTEKMLADVFTKSLPTVKHKFCIECLGLC
jgi:hypothetical protein